MKDEHILDIHMLQHDHSSQQSSAEEPWIDGKEQGAEDRQQSVSSWKVSY